MPNWYRELALSESGMIRIARRIYRYIACFSVPAPRLIVRPALACFLLVRAVYYFLARVCFCEPLFKAYCTRYGRNLHTGVFLHWVQGWGEIILGDDVTIDGKCSFFFAARYSHRPQLSIGDGTGIGHNCSFVVGKQITIGRHCRIAGNVQILDSPGHPTDPDQRRAGMPARPEDVRPIVIQDNVWIGNNAIIFPGVTIGEGAVIAAGAVVMNNVPPNTLVAGNPARQLASLAKTTPNFSEHQEGLKKTHA
jgi:acetyltransferase-like isoleucine patch superfamily enzyme